MITPKAWRTEKEQLEKEMPTLRNERAGACHDLAFAEVISNNKSNLERMEQNESRQQNRQQTVNRTVGRTKRKEEEIAELLRIEKKQRVCYSKRHSKLLHSALAKTINERFCKASSTIFNAVDLVCSIYKMWENGKEG